jgi:hypothetical protein
MVAGRLTHVSAASLLEALGHAFALHSIARDAPFRRTTYRPQIAATADNAQRHGFLVLSRATRWRVRYAEEKRSEWSGKENAEELMAQWRGGADDTLEEAEAEIRQAREKFIARTEIEIVSVRNPNPFQVDYRKPTITFPDGSTLQFAEAAPEDEIRKAIEDAAGESHPDPAPTDLIGTPPQLESAKVWEREFLDNRGRLPYSDIFTWDHYFPMSEVAQTLDELAEDGWSLVNSSEDRGLFRSDLAESVSAPLTIRYLLVREGGTV